MIRGIIKEYVSLIDLWIFCRYLLTEQHDKGIETYVVYAQ